MFKDCGYNYPEIKKEMDNYAIHKVEVLDKAISKTESKRRNAEVRHARNDFKAKTISSQLSALINKINPDIVVIEKNYSRIDACLNICISIM